MKFTHIDKGKARMVDISDKGDVVRIARAEGFIKLKEETLKAIEDDSVSKGNVFATARIAGIMAGKKTHEIIPLCHQIPITSISVDFSVEKDGVRAVVEVKSVGKTGVEMEAITATSVALLTIWDMVKSLEKDETGNYPHTEIRSIRVTEKRKM